MTEIIENHFVFSVRNSCNKFVLVDLDKPCS